jgi:hypothetical protein
MVHSAFMPGMAFDKALECQPKTFAAPMLLDSFHRIVRAAGIKAAALPKKRADAELVKTDQF